MTDENEMKGERIAKVLARAGIASRRAVERLIEAGRITIHGKPLDTPAFLVTSLKGIAVDGQPVAEAEETKLYRFHKRKGTLCTYFDPEGRNTVFENLPEAMGRVISVGRLDMNTEGLLLLTNDGELARWMELPENQLVRKYRVRVYGRVQAHKLESLKNGVSIEGVHYGEIDATLEKQQGANAWLIIGIKEGKNREVRKVLEHIGYEVNRLIRISYGPFTLGKLPMEGSAEVPKKQLQEMLPDFFGKRQETAANPDAKKLSPEKWAKPKKKAGVKPGQKRRDKFKAEKRRSREGDAK